MYPRLWVLTPKTILQSQIADMDGKSLSSRPKFHTQRRRETQGTLAEPRSKPEIINHQYRYVHVFVPDIWALRKRSELALARLITVHHCSVDELSPPSKALLRDHLQLHYKLVACCTTEPSDTHTGGSAIAQPEGN